jgi:hypothetical protein
VQEEIAAAPSAPKSTIKKEQKPTNLFPTIVVKVRKSDELKESNEISRPRIVPNN